MQAITRLDAIRAGELGVWFPFVGNFEILIRYLSPRKMREMRDECTTVRRTAKGLVDDIDTEALEQKFRDYVIADWRGANEEMGDDFACSDENKQLLLDGDTDFADFINRTTVSLDAFVERLKEAARGNLPSGPATTPPRTIESAGTASGA